MKRVDFVSNKDFESKFNDLLRDSIEIAIGSAYMNIEGIHLLTNYLEKVGKNFNKKIRILLSEKFHEKKAIRLLIIEKLVKIPNVEVKVYSKDDKRFHAKIFIFSTGDTVNIISGSYNLTGAGFNDNVEAGTLIQGEKDEPSIKQAMEFFEENWNISNNVQEFLTREMNNPEPKFKNGQIVKLVNTEKSGVICEDPKKISNEYYYSVFIDNIIKTYSENSLELAEKREKDLNLYFQNGQFASLNAFQSYITFIKIERPLSNNLYSFLSSRTEFEVYQFKPVLKYLQSPYERLLIADEVGVGKTIEASIIYTELLSRHDLSRVLIVCPSALRFKWAKELSKRFDEEFGILDSEDMRLFFRRYERFPNGTALRGIASMQMLRNEEILNDLERLQIPFDLIIVDEAHHMRNSETKSFRLGKILSECSDGLVFLSATPLHLGNQDLYNLLNILVPEEFDNLNTFEEQVKPNEFINLTLRKISKKDDPKQCLETLRNVENTSQKERFLSNPIYNSCVESLSKISHLEHEDVILLQRKLSDLNVLSQIYTRTKKREIDINSPMREPHTIQVSLTPQEKEFYAKVTELVIKLHPGSPPGFLLQMPQRQVASCIPAAREYFKDIYTSGMIDLAEEDVLDEEEFENERLIFTKAELAELKNVIGFAETIQEPDSKFTEFIKAIREIIQAKELKKIIIFSFFKRTLKYLERKLREEGLSVARIDGDVPFAMRDEIIENFSDPNGYQILLSSEVGGEGLDMQFCNCMFNYDLPWNPMRVEQRIGRLDRYGQANPKIHIYNFSVEDTIETDIFLRLCNRIGIFETYIGELEPILGDTIKQLTKEIFSSNLTPEQQKLKADQAAMAIEQKKQELEIFDKERSKFLGQDEYFTEQISDIQRKERFITPEEISNFFNSFLSNNFPKTRIDGNDGLYNVKPDKDFIDFMNDYFKKGQLNNESMERIRDIIKKDSFRITFDYKTANKYPHMEFITIRHPFIKSVIDKYNKKDFDIITKISYLDKSAPEECQYLFFIYLLEIKSFTKSLTFVPVVIEINNIQVSDSYSDNLFNIIKNSKDNDGDITLDMETVRKCEKLALEHMIYEKKKKEQELKETNESLINDRLNSLKQTYEIRSKHLNDVIDRMRQNLTENTQKIINMKESQKINLTRNYEKRKRELEDDKKIVVSHELIGGGLLHVGKYQ